MFTEYRRRRQVAKVKPGDGSPVPEYRCWQLFSRSLFVLELPDGELGQHVYEVDVRHGADSTSRRSPVSFYRDGAQVGRATLPAAFPVPGGVIEVAVGRYGLRRMHFLADDGTVRALRPHPRSTEGLRARFGRRFPRTSAVVGAVAVAVVLAGLALSGMIALEAITRVPVVAAHVGVVTAPIHLDGWAEVAVTLATALAATERALTLRSRWLLGGSPPV